MFCAVTVEKVSKQSAIEVRRAEQPIRDRKSEVHVHFHH